MKLFFLALVAFALQAQAQNQSKHALIIAISSYAPGTGWSRTGATNDVPLLKAALLQQGFINQRITVLTEAAATKANITSALRALASQVKPGDAVVVHFSGHGQQVQDDNGDEADGYDEALVPYDAPKHYIAGQYEGQQHLRDDELAALLHSVRQQLGPQGELLVLLDACHSGTGTRGLGTSRGTAEPLAAPDYAPANSGTRDSSFLADAKGAAATLAPQICFAAAGPHELNYETTDDNGNSVGPLTLAFAQTLSSFTTAPTYEALFDRIKGKMAGSAPYQTPQLEGARSVRLFQGKAALLLPHHKVMRWLSSQRLVLDAGTLQGLYEQTEIALHPPDGRPGQGKALATGRVVVSELTRATVELTKPLPGTLPAAWVFVTARNYGRLAISLRLDIADQALKNHLEANLRQWSFVRVVPAGPADVVAEVNNQFTEGNNLQLTTAQDQVVYRQPATKDLVVATSEVVDVLAGLAQARYLRSLQAHAEHIRVELMLVPVTVKKEDGRIVVTQQLALSSRLDGAGQLRYQAGDYCQLRVANRGTKDAYFTILDIQPDNALHVLLPGASEDDDPADYLLPAGEERTLPRLIHLSPPCGQEVFKVISTEQPLDLRPLVRSRGRDQSRGLDSPFSQLLHMSYQPVGSRGLPPPLPTESVNTSEVIFLISQP